MPVNSEDYKNIFKELQNKSVELVAVSKTKPPEDILQLYKLGARNFGENYVQELADKYDLLPKDIHWHFIGHLQSNKVKLIVPFVSLIQGVDSKKIFVEIDKQGKKINKVINCLLQVHIAKEETKFGFDETELAQLFDKDLINCKNVHVRGLMGMASFTDDINIIKDEFKKLKSLYDKYSSPSFNLSAFNILSMGMSSDYKIAIEEGSNMVRIGSLLFGKR